MVSWHFPFRLIKAVHMHHSMEHHTDSIFRDRSCTSALEKNSLKSPLIRHVNGNVSLYCQSHYSCSVIDSPLIKSVTMATT